MSRIYKKTSTDQREKRWQLNQKMAMNHNCTKENIQMPVRLHYLSGKCKLKLQEETTTYTPTWLNWKWWEIPSDGGDVEQLERSYIAEGLVTLYCTVRLYLLMLCMYHIGCRYIPKNGYSTPRKSVQMSHAPQDISYNVHSSTICNCFTLENATNAHPQ